jgi:hypothetical protein
MTPSAFRLAVAEFLALPASIVHPDAKMQILGDFTSNGLLSEPIASMVPTAQDFFVGGAAYTTRSFSFMEWVLGKNMSILLAILIVDVLAFQ